MAEDLYMQEVIAPGDRASKLAHEVCVGSYGNCPAVVVVPHQPGNFRGPVGFVWRREILREMVNYTIDDGKVVDWSVLEEVENDGAGGKPQFFSLLGTTDAFRGLGWEIIVMTADDFARSGRFPCIIANEMNAKRVTDRNFILYQTAMMGYDSALKQAGLVNITGETAIMKNSITAFCDSGMDHQFILTWGATCIGLARKDRLIDGSKIRPGMVIYGLWEPGYRCNGGTLLTNLVLKRFGSDPDKILSSNKAMDFIKQLTIPSVSYAKMVTNLLGWLPDGSVRDPLANLYGIAHITGGGVWSKLGDILPPGVGADLYMMPAPADVLLEAQAMSVGTEFKLSDWSAYSTFHGGCGMMLITDKENNSSAAAIHKEAQRCGIRVDLIGETTSSSEKEIVIHSRFLNKGILSSLKPE